MSDNSFTEHGDEQREKSTTVVESRPPKAAPKRRTPEQRYREFRAKEKTLRREVEKARNRRREFFINDLAAARGVERASDDIGEVEFLAALRKAVGLAAADED